MYNVFQLEVCLAYLVPPDFCVYVCIWHFFFFYPESVSLLKVVAYETALPSEKATHLQRFKGNGLLRGAGGALCMLE